MRSLILCVAGLLAAVPAFGAIRTEMIEYKDGDTILEGYLAYDDAVSGKRPGVLIVHAWMGLGEQSKDSARRLAEMGYVAFGLDMYGKGVYAANREEASKLAGAIKGDRAKMRQRAIAGLNVLRNHELCDSSHVAAIGYCFGGTTVLEIARSGEPIQGVVSFHGGLDSPTPADAKNIKAKVLVLHGADDPGVPPEQVAAFQQEMRDGGVDWQMIHYGGAVHSFTDPDANTPGRAMYHEPSARRSWQAMTQFFDEVLK
ncbi:MAG: dienelactone hydrolase family protein [Candidatus Hydrogenedentes bacterium]|nr:dienelactone hydrolase family protein [Candidatus Hydrogenedentota bacterium]